MLSLTTTCTFTRARSCMRTRTYTAYAQCDSSGKGGQPREGTAAALCANEATLDTIDAPWPPQPNRECTPEVGGRAGLKALFHVARPTLINSMLLFRGIGSAPTDARSQ